MIYEKLSPALAALMFEYVRFPEATAASVNGTRPQSLSVSAAGLPETTVFVYCDKDAEFEDLPGVRVISGKGEIRTAKVELEKISDLSEHGGVRYLAVSMRLKPLNDLAAIENGLNEFKNNHPELNGAEVIFGIINSGIDASQPIFAGRIHGIWDQTLTENNADGQIYGKFLTGDSLTECTDADGNGTRTAKLVADFAAQFGGAMENIVVVKTNFQNAHLADAVKYIFETAQSSGKTAIVNLNLDDFFDVRKDADDFSNFIGQEISAEKIVIPIVGNNAERKIWATAVIASNKFSPAKFKFVVPSNSQPGSPPEVVLRGWFESSGDCEITIFSPNGGVTRSTQPATIEGNPTRFGIYTNSQAFLTKPSISPAPNGRREFFIDLQPIPPEQFVVGGVWKLTVTNVGNAEVTVSVLSWSPEKAKDVVFI